MNRFANFTWPAALKTIHGYFFALMNMTALIALRLEVVVLLVWIANLLRADATDLRCILLGMI